MAETDICDISFEDSMALMARLSRNFRDIPAPSLGKAVQSLYNRKNTYKATLPAPKNTHVANEVFGVQGRFFARTKQRSKINFIWFDEINGLYIFVGSRRAVLKAIEAIAYRVSICQSRQSLTG